MTFEEYRQQDATALANLVRTKQVTPEELLDVAIARSEAVHPKINAVITPLYDYARQSIKRIKSDAPFAGVPFLLKDLDVQLAGTPFGGGSAMFKGYISKVTSDVVQKIIDSGLLVFGKTNVPEFGITPYAEPKTTGSAHNPWSLERTTGGSSGGSGAAVAAGIVPMAFASDGGGSIRIPASCNGLFGIKPSRGRMSNGPLHGEVWSGAVSSGIISRSIRDAALYLDCTIGASIGDPYIVQMPDRPFAEQIKNTPGKLRIGYSSQHPFDEQDEENIRAMEQTVKLLRDCGHEAEEVALPYDSVLMRDCLYTMVMGELSATIDAIAKERGRAASVKEIEPTNWLLYSLGKKLTANEFCFSKMRWNELSRAMQKFHERYDLLLTPTLGMRPFKIGELQPKNWEQTGLKILNKLGLSGALKNSSLIEDTKKKIFKWIPYPPLANLTGQPSMTVPLHWSADNLPVGVLFTGRLNDDGTLLQLAARLEKAQPWFEKTATL
jgi:amidase